VAEAIALGNLDVPVELASDKDALGKALRKMAQDLKSYIETIEETTAAKERIESELRIAREIQMGILPKIFPPFPERHEFEIYAILEPAKEVGGDFYDFFFIDDDHLCFAVGDVSGKGVPAALFMAVSKTLVKMKATRGLTSDQVLSTVNQDLSLENPSLMFVTILLGILNIRSGELEYSNGGHPPPFILRTDGEVMELELPEGLPLGVMEDYDYQSKKIVLKKGETIFLYTDGVTEAMNPEEELFSDERLKQTLARLRESDIKEIAHGVQSETETFSTGTTQSDDITMLALRFYG
jgi:sigma-B regulation protein RsbU (phosphoserine phosphatase)